MTVIPQRIDCDIHVHPRSGRDIADRLEEPWKHRFGLRTNLYYKNPAPPEAGRHPAGGGPPGSDPALLREQWIGPMGIERAILFTSANVSANHDPDYGTAVAAAYNEWLADTWLGSWNPDGLFKGSILVNHADPAAAAAEIDRWAGHPHFVQVQLETGARAPFGNRQYRPLLEAAARNGLPVALHPGSESMGVNKPVWLGYPSQYTAYYTGFSFAMQSHLVSLLTEGAFERHPGLRLVIAEGGVTWLPALLWRLDANWKGLRSEVPWMKRRPSDYVREHVRFTMQPLERPASDGDLLDVLAMMDAGSLLMFSSDYPERHRDAPESALPKLPADWEAGIYGGNARMWYGL